jgi:hypothetical protein
MSRYKRQPQKIGGVKVLTAHRDYSDLCNACGDFIKRGQWYVRRGKEIAHYYCQKKDASS